MKTEASDKSESANNPKTIWIFTPSRTDPEYLEAILVQRKALLKDAVERVSESALTKHKHHQLFVGPRGCGKTHFVTLVVDRVSKANELEGHLLIAWLNEDETCTTLLELLSKIQASLEKRYPGEFQEEQVAKAYELKSADALEFMSKHLLTSLGSRTLLVVVENLDAIFVGLEDSGQKQLRAFLQENPKFTIVATAQKLVKELADRGKPFFGFFQTEHLKPLNVEEATELLQNIARLHNKDSVVEFLSTNRGRSRVRALHHLSGGNHRIYIVLSQFITRDSIESLLAPFMKMVDELTPYYQERIRWLPRLQRKIVEYLCACEGTVPVKEIAKKLFSSPQSISSQLQDLRDLGYVEANQRGRESLYEISEPLMRICVEVKENQGHQPLRLLVDFLRVWYDDQELKLRLQKADIGSESCAYLESAIHRNNVDGNLRKQIFLNDLRSFMPDKLAPTQRASWARELASQPEVVLMAAKSLKEGNQAEAIRYVTEAILQESSPVIQADIFLFRAGVYSKTGEGKKAIEDYSAVIGLAGASVEQVAQALGNRGVTYMQTGEPERALKDFTAVIGLEGVSVDQIAQGLVTRGFVLGRMGETQRALEDYATVIGLAGAPAQHVALAYFNRGVMLGRKGETKLAIKDYSAVNRLLGAPVEHIAQALVNRGAIHDQLGDSKRAVKDYSAVIDLAGAPVGQVAKAYFNRGISHGRAWETQLALNDFTAVIELVGAPVEQVAKAYFNRGFARGQTGDTRGALKDYTAVIELADAPVQQVARALGNRGATYSFMGETQLAKADYTAVIELVGAPVEHVARALVNRGATHGFMSEAQLAIADYTAAIELVGAPVEHVARALVNRGATYIQLGEMKHAIEDYTAVIGLVDAPVELIAHALVDRGISYGQIGETQHEIEDYSTAIELADATVEYVARALFRRGVTYFQLSHKQQSQSDFETLISLSNVPTKEAVDAHLALSELHFSEGRWIEGFHVLESGLKQSTKSNLVYYGTAIDLVSVVFFAGLNAESRFEKVGQLLGIYDKHKALPVLGEAVVQHIGRLFRAGAPFPSTDNLEGWISAWEQASEKVPDFRLSLRLLRTGVNFVKAGGKDPGILLDLTSTERSILEQALGLTGKEPATST